MAYSIDYLYRIQDRFSSVLAKMGAASTKFTAGVNKIQSKLGNLENKFKTAGGKLANLSTGLASLGAGIFLRGALEESMEFQRSLNLTKAVTGATADEMDRMKQAALDWGSSTQFSSKAIAAAMAELGKMGNSTTDILDLMPGTMALAAAGELEMAEAANFSMGILNQFGMELNQAGEVADILATGASNAATSVRGISSAMNNAGLMSKMAGLSITDTTIALMAMAKKNLEGAEAGTMLKNAMKALTVMPEKVRTGFGKLGINIDDFRDKTTGQMTDFFGLIKAMKAAGANAENMGKMFDIRQMTAFSALVETSSEDLAGFTDVMSDVSGNAEKMKNTLNEGLDPLIEFKSLMQNLKVIMGEFIVKALNPVLKKFNAWLSNMQKNNPQFLKFLTTLLMVITAVGAIIVPLGLFISAIGSVIGVVKTIIGLTKVWSAVQGVLNIVLAANPIGAVIMAIMALVVAVKYAIDNWDVTKASLDKIYDAFYRINQFIAVTFVKAWTTLKNAVSTNIAYMKLAWFTFIDIILSTVGKLMKTVMSGFSDIGKALGFDTSKLDASIAKIESMQKNAREQSLVGINEQAAESHKAAFSDNSFNMVPRPEGQGFSQRSTDLASLKVYTQEGIKVEPYEPSKNLGYNVENRSVR